MEITFSILGYLSPAIRQLLQEFEQQSGHSVRVISISWEKGWSELLNYALHAHGPDVSMVGSTWTPSLAAMNALRPFTPPEVSRWGGPQAFLPPCWQSTWVSSPSEIYAAPWTAYTFVVCYRRDHLQKAGLDETSAFASSTALVNSLEALQQAGYSRPLALHHDPEGPHPLHIIVSWVWEAGKDLFCQPHQLECGSPEMAAACGRYFDIWRRFSSPSASLSIDEAEECFTRGEASVLICGADRPYVWMTGRGIQPEAQENLGVAAIPGVPWVGGDNLIIWKHAAIDPRQERAAVQLVEFLTGEEAQIFAMREEELLPTRRTALEYLPFPASGLTQSVKYSLQNGRAYDPIAIWGRVENDFRLTLNQIARQIQQEPDITAVVRQNLSLLQNRLQTVLAS